MESINVSTAPNNLYLPQYAQKYFDCFNRSCTFAWAYTFHFLRRPQHITYSMRMSRRVQRWLSMRNKSTRVLVRVQPVAKYLQTEFQYFIINSSIWDNNEKSKPFKSDQGGLVAPARPRYTNQRQACPQDPRETSYMYVIFHWSARASQSAMWSFVSL